MLIMGHLLRFWTMYRQRKSAVFGLLVVAVVISAIALAPHIAPYDPSLRVGAAFEPPSWRHVLGTNDIGVDIFSELI